MKTQIATRPDGARSLPKVAAALFWLVALCAGAWQMTAGAATLTTDKIDYPPFSDVLITGTGYAPGETVQLTLDTQNPDASWTQLPGTVDFPNPWTVTADASGNISDSWYVYTDDFLGVTFRLSALGLTSGATASTIFTDGNVDVFTSFNTTATIVYYTYDDTDPRDAVGDPDQSESCGGGTESGPFGQATDDGGKVYGIGSGSSIKFIAPALSNEGGPFTGWTWQSVKTNGNPGPGDPDFVVTLRLDLDRTGRTICVQGFTGQNGFDNRVIANYSITTDPCASATVFYETMGTVLTDATIAAHEAANGFDNDAQTMTGTATVGAGQPSNLAGSSAGANILFEDAAPTTFLIEGIDTTGRSNMELHFAVLKQGNDLNGSDLQVAVSSDGTSYTTLSYVALPMGGGENGWYYRIATGAIPETSNLRVRVSRTDVAEGGHYRVDDIRIYGKTLCSITGPSLVAQGTQNVVYTGPAGDLSSEYSWSITGNATIDGSTTSKDVVVDTLDVCGGSFELTLTYTEFEICESTCSKTVNLVDTQPPSIDCPANVVGLANDAGECGAVVNYTPPVGTDNCPGASTELIAGLPPGFFPVGTTTVTYRVTDAAGLTDECTFTVEVIDVEEPNITDCPDDRDVILNGTCGLLVPDLTGEVGAEDNCIFEVSQSPAAATVVASSHNGIVVVTITVTDGAGMTDTCQVTLTGKDVTPPEITVCPANRNVSLDANCDITVPDLTGEVIATDNCTVLVSQSPLPTTVLDSSHNQLHVVTITVTDGAGLTDTCLVTLTAKDVTPPEITDCPIDRDVNLDEDCGLLVPDLVAEAKATDNCTVTLTQSPTAGTILPSSHNQVHTVTITATDAAGLTDTCGVDLTGKDVTPPEITDCPDDRDVNLNGDCELVVPNLLGDLKADDNCTFTPTQDPAAGTELPSAHNQTHVVTITVTDGAGLTDTCTLTLTGKDVTPPEITDCPDNREVNLDDNCDLTVPDLTQEVVAGDNCKYTVTQDPSGGTVLGSSHGQTHTVIITVTDDAGLTDTCTVTLTGRDVTPPEITDCPIDRDVNLDEDCGLLVPDLVAEAKATDNCTVTLTQDPKAGTILPSSHNQVHTVTITATDGAGLTDTCEVDLTGKDVTPPTITKCPADRAVNLDGDCKLLVPDLTQEVIAGDNCTFTATQLPTAGSLVASSHNGTVVVTITVTDGAGLTDECEVTLTGKDVTPPEITDCPDDRNVNLDGDCKLLVPDVASEVVADDNCTYTATQSPTAGSLVASSHNGTVVVTVTVTDDAGLTDTCEVTLTGKDVTPPEITDCPDDRDVNLNANCDLVVPNLLPDLVADDNCTFTPTQSPTAGSVLSSSHGQTHTVTITVTDGAGLTDTCTVTLTGNDATPPVITECPPEPWIIIVPSSVGPPEPLTLEEFDEIADFDDNCAVTELFVEDVYPPGIDPEDPTECGFDLLRNYYVKDAAGNVSATACTQTIRIICPSLVTSSSLCTFDVDPCSEDDREFRLNWHPDPLDGGKTYRLTSSNPGQTYYNVFYGGTPGTPVTLTIKIPYPYITHGATPIHVYDGFDIDQQEGGGYCITLPEGASNVPSVIHAGTGKTSPAGNEIIVIGDYGTCPTISSWTTVTIETAIPDSGQFWVAIHLDYGHKQTNGWLPAVDGAGKPTGAVKKDCVTVGVSPACGAPATDARKQGYVFSFTDGEAVPIADDDTVYSLNDLKKIAGWVGAALKSPALGGDPVAGVTVEAFDSAGAKVGSAVTDANGTYFINYKHKAKAATYTLKIKAYGLSQQSTIKANGFGLVNFEVGPR